MSTTHVPPDVVRLSVNLAPDVANALRDAARQDGFSVTEGIRRAISLLVFFGDVYRRGATVHVQERNGSEREVRFW